MCNISQPIRNIIILGNRHLSRTILAAFLPEKQYEITLITYPKSQPYLLDNADASRITHKSSDFSKASLQTLFKDQDLVISTLPPGDLSLQKRIVEACVAAGVRCFIPNEFGFDSTNSKIRELLPSYQARAELVEYLETTELKWIAIPVGTILDHELLNGKLGFDLKWHSASIPGQRDVRFPATSLKRVGEVVARVVERWDDLEKGYIYAAGCLNTAGETLRCLQKETKADWVMDITDPNDAMRSAEKMLQGGWPDAGWSVIERAVTFDNNIGGAENFLASNGNKDLGLEDEKVEGIIHNTVHTWNHTEKGDCGCN